MHVPRPLLVLLLLAFAGMLPAQVNDERILGYDSFVTVHADASLTVREVIKVRATGVKIKHGIFRDFPVVYAGGMFTRRTVGFEVKEVLRDGKPEPYHTKNEGDNVRVYIGHENLVLKPGVYTYSLTYTTDRQLGFFDDHDELYWNVTGNFWDFPIDAVTCTVTLPEDVPREKTTHEGYTGPKGAKGADYESQLLDDGTVFFRSTRSLSPHEGLTVVATWSKGFVREPAGGGKAAGFLRDNVLVSVAGAGLVLVFVYYLFAWAKVGRDPEKGIVIPLFEPPDGMSPAAVRFVRRMGFDRTCVPAAVVDAAVKGYLTINEKDGEFTLRRTGGADTSGLSDDERALVTHILTTKSVTLDHTHHTRFQSATKKFKKALSAAYEGTLFRTNRWWFIPGLVLSALVFVIGALSEVVFGSPGRAGDVLGISLWLTIWTMGVYALLIGVGAAWRSVARDPKKIIGAVFMTAFAIPFLIGECVGLGFLVFASSLLMIPILIGFVVLNVLFARLLKAPTVAGREVMDRIDGFRMYLATAEREMLEAAHSPERTPGLFEKFLPYAIALGVENAWAEKFAEVLAATEAAPDLGGYHPGWYSGTAAIGALGVAGIASSLSGSFSSALSAASTAPGSSSGSGGGGSSGGGGGGGGGGGW